MNAVLIMCHKNPEQVLRLINRCKSTSTLVFVHVDASQNNIFNWLKKHVRGVYFTKKRLKGTLFTRSLVDITIALIRCAKDIERDKKIHFDYYILLSGQDYLIEPINKINSILKESYPTPYIDCTPYNRRNWLYHPFKSTGTLNKYGRWIRTKFPKRGTFIRKCFAATEIIGQYLARLLHIDDYHKLTKGKVSLYGGSEWWILPDLAISYILKEYDAMMPYIKILLEDRAPDETFFQTITMRSPIKDIVHINPYDMVAQSCQTFAYFSDIGKPFTGHPYILTAKEFDMLTSSGRWIARKFDINEDEKILDLLDKRSQEMDGQYSKY